MADFGVSFAVSAALTGLQAAGGVMQGVAGRNAAKAQGEAALRQAEYGRIQAAQTDRAMRDQFEFTLGNIQAVRAAAGQDPNSPTGQTLTNFAQSQADMERQRKVSNVLTQVSEQERAARFYRRSGGNQMLGGLLSAAGSIARGVAGGLNSSGGSSWGWDNQARLQASGVADDWG